MKTSFLSLFLSFLFLFCMFFCRHFVSGYFAALCYLWIWLICFVSENFCMVGKFMFGN